jgi:hypothetical protein
LGSLPDKVFTNHTAFVDSHALELPSSFSDNAGDFQRLVLCQKIAPACFSDVAERFSISRASQDALHELLPLGVARLILFVMGHGADFHSGFDPFGTQREMSEGLKISSVARSTTASTEKGRVASALRSDSISLKYLENVPQWAGDLDAFINKSSAGSVHPEFRRWWGERGGENYMR